MSGGHGGGGHKKSSGGGHSGGGGGGGPERMFWEVAKTTVGVALGIFTLGIIALFAGTRAIAKRGGHK